MAEPGYKSLITYKLAQIAFDLGWNFVPQYYSAYEDHRQRDQIKQALRSLKQNTCPPSAIAEGNCRRVVEGCSERSLSSKLKLYDVSKSSGMEALEDFEDILRLEKLPHWPKNDPRLVHLRRVFEGYPSYPPNSPNPPFPSVATVCKALGIRGNRRIRGGEHQLEVEAVANYMVDLLTRNAYLMDKQINAVEDKHRTEGGYSENLLKRRLKYRQYQR